MKQIYYTIIDYKEVHPVRFWVLIIGVIIFLTGTIYILNRWLKSTKKIKTDNPDKNIEIEAKSDSKEDLEVSEEKVIRNNSNISKLLIGIITVQMAIIIFLLGVIIFYQKSSNNKSENTSISSSEYVFGIDISQYQGEIDWIEVRTSHHPVEFVFMRATMGEDGIDRYFKRNWENAKKHNYVRGAYHYYRPNENSTKQFENFKSVVKLKQGDFIPVLDIEKESKYGHKNLREGVLNWLKLAEQEYGVKPIIYTGLKFYEHILKGHVDEYPLWIAAYSNKHRLDNVDWTFHQFTEKVRIKGIRSTVDGNDFKGELIELDKLRITNANTQ
jgi:lysozyme